MDCAGVCFGDAEIDDCGVCDGNNSDMDECGVCFGSGYTDNCGVCDDDPDNDCIQDCNGDWGGSAELDDCGICEGDNSTCTGCTDPEAVNFDPEAIISCDDCCDYTFTQELALDMAANLVSFNVLPEEPTIVNILEPIAGNVFSVIGESNATQYTDDGLWIGSLTSVDQWSGYWLLLNESDVLTIEGNPTDPGEYELQYGANLLSYPFNVSSAIQDALPSDVVGTIYSVMSQNEVSILIDGDWVGSLTHFIPGNGYWFKSNEDISFSYNAPSFSRSKVEKTVPSGFEVAQSSKCAFYMIESIDIAEEGDWIVAYNGDVIVGIREWNGNNTDVPSMGSDNQFYSVGYCTEGETPSFKLIKETTGELIDLVGNVPSWENNTVLFVNSLTDEANTLPYDVNLNSVYPNPFNPVTTIHYSTETQSRVSLQIYNVQGQLVETLVDGLVDAGYYEMMWDAKLQPSGIYFVRLQSASSMQIQKIMLLK